MILIMKPSATREEITEIAGQMESLGLAVHEIKGENTFVMGLVGDTSVLSAEAIMRNECIDRVLKVQEPYKLAGRRFHSEDSVVEVMGHRLGGGGFAVMAGPCSVESEDQILSIARDVKEAGAGFLRGGAFKPRSSPYAFQGLGLDGLELLKAARRETGLPIVSEIMDPQYLEVFAQDVDVIQIGARNMQNFSLLREVGQLGKPVLLKRGLSNTIDELLMAAEYVLAGDKSQVILCERGIRTFETATRNTLDLSAIPVLKQRSHLPVIVDPSHGTGYWNLVFPMALAAVAAGADGLIIEVHNRPDKALCDGQQSITPALFGKLMERIALVREAIQQ